MTLITNYSPLYDGQHYSFSQPRPVYLPGRKNGGIVGTLGLGPTPLTVQIDLGVSKGKGPRTGWSTNVGPILRPDISRGLSPDIGRPMSTRLTFRLGAWGFHSPDGLFRSDAYFPEHQFSQAKLPIRFLSYKRKFIHELTSSLPTK